MRKNLLSKIAIFIAGAGVGAVVTYKVVSNRYEQIIQQEVDSVKEAFSNRNEKTEEIADEEETEEPTDKEVYDSIVKDTGYAVETEKKEDKKMDKPYVISPSEFGDSDYAMLSFTYFLDGTVLNERDKIVSNVTELIGDDYANHFDEYEDDPDTVYVRNDKLGIDFEVLRDYREYSEVI